MKCVFCAGVTMNSCTAKVYNRFVQAGLHGHASRSSGLERAVEFVVTMRQKAFFLRPDLNTGPSEGVETWGGPKLRPCGCPEGSLPRADGGPGVLPRGNFQK